MLLDKDLLFKLVATIVKSATAILSLGDANRGGIEQSFFWIFGETVLSSALTIFAVLIPKKDVNTERIINEVRQRTK